MPDTRGRGCDTISSTTLKDLLVVISVHSQPRPPPELGFLNH